jgi:hypothetical protein
MIRCVAIYARLKRTEPEFPSDYRQTVENRGDTVVATYFDDARITGRGKHAGWRKLLANLHALDQIVIPNAGGRSPIY